jgi:hypothetical protein
MSTHICLVSAQAAANLLPALDPALKPTHAILLVTGKMQRQADALQSVLQGAGVKVSQLALADEHDFSQISAAVLEMAAGSDDADIALNLTGGTKLMALAAQEVAQAAGWKTFYIDADTDEIIWLGQQTGTRQKLGEQLRLRHYLQGYGFTLPETPRQPGLEARHRRLIETLLLQIGSLEAPLGQLNWLAQQAERSLKVQLDERQRDSLALDALLRNFEEADVLLRKGEQLAFKSETDRAFANGGWLEACAFQAISSNQDALGIRDKALGLEIVDSNSVKNELDIAFMARNRLFVIECKTQRMDKPGDDKANNALFKLAEVSRRAGGLGTRAMLLSYRALREPEKKLAAALGIKVVAGTDLQRLDEHLKQWTRT